MRANLDESALNDGRFRRLTRLMEWPHIDFAIGAVMRLWLAALNRVDESNPEGLITREDAEDATDHRGLVAAMLEAKLADDRGQGLLYFHGLQERAAFLLTQRAKGRVPKRPKPDGGGSQPPASGSGSPGLAPASVPRSPGSLSPKPHGGNPQAYSPDLDLDLDLDLAPDLVPDPDPKTHEQASLLVTEPVRQFDFLALYKRHPKKRGKAAGMKACLKHFKTQGDYEALARAVDRYARECRGKDPQFVMHWSTFVNGGWKDFSDENAAMASSAPAAAPAAPTYKPPVVVNPVAPEDVRALASGVLANLRNGVAKP